VGRHKPHCAPSNRDRGAREWPNRAVQRSLGRIDFPIRQKVCRKFYYDKTMERLSALYKNFHIADGPTVVNGVEIPPTAEMLARLRWDWLCEGVPVFFHGDLQFDNVLYDEEASRFVLLDWRQEFGGRVDLGDLYYDLAKLYGGLLLNYDYIKQNLLSYSENEKDGSITFDFAQRFLTPVYVSILEEFILANGWDLAKVRTLVALIYLNMSPLHHDPFSRMLYSLGRLRLYRELTHHDR